MSISFEGQVVLVTGGSRGLGNAFARCAAAAGATVVVNSTGEDDRGTTQSIIDSGGKAVHLPGRVEDSDNLVSRVVESCGRIDAIIHNAGFLRDKTLRKMTDEQWDEVLDVHLKTSFKLMRAAWPHFLEQGRGRVVLISSSAGLYGNFGQANYAAAKMGMYGLARSAALEGGRDNITCNCLAPLGATEMNSGSWPEKQKRVTLTDYVAPLAVYLAHPDCTESGSLFEASAGSFKKVRWEQSEGLNLDPSSDEVSLNAIADNWDNIVDFSSSTHPRSMGESLQGMFGRFMVTE